MKNAKLLSSLSLLLLILSASLIIFSVNSKPLATTNNPTPTPIAGIAEEAYEVSKVVDGDTIEVMKNGQILKVRFIGINTPETVDPRRGVQCFGKEASDETKNLLNGQRVILEKDISDKDKYDRLLRYVFRLNSDGSMVFVNDYLVRMGFAQVSTYPPDVKYEERFKKAQRLAKINKIGLWGRCPL